MAVHPIALEDALPHITAGARVIIDVRSQGEFACGHIPGAVNIPLLNNEEREAVGTCYKNQGHDAAVDLGFRLVGGKFADYAQQARAVCGQRETIVYCWRGGLRSSIMSWVFDLAGVRVSQLQGGYKSWRRECLNRFGAPYRLVLLSGMTGCGKTAILEALRNAGEQVIDLEKIAAHKGSSFGRLGMPEQPAQEHFENRIALALLRLNHNKWIWVEDESRFIGKVRIPDVFFTRMEQSAEVELVRSRAQRIQRVIEEYGVFSAAELEDRTAVLSKRMGSEQVGQAIEALNQGDLVQWSSLLLDYYDKRYVHTRNKRRAVNGERSGSRLLVELDGPVDRDAVKVAREFYDAGGNAG
jgi:tRNA 2-selenouridine synthase